MKWPKLKLKARIHEPASERRLTHREKIRFVAEMDEIGGFIRAHGLDIHAQGALVTCNQSWPVGRRLFVRFKDLRVGALSEVRHCTRRKDGTCAIGLRFCRPLAPLAGSWTVARVSANDGWTDNDELR